MKKDRYKRHEPYENGYSPMSLKPNSPCKIFLKGKMINAKSIGVVNGSKLDATANGKKYFCEWKNCKWTVISEI